MRYESLDSLMERVVRENDRKVDMLADTRRMSVEVVTPDEGGTHVDLTVDEEDGVSVLEMSDHSLGQMATDLGIPKRYFDRMKVDAPDLFRRNAHHWLYAEPKRRMLRGFRRPEGGAKPLLGRAWLSDRYRRLDNIEIATRLLPEFERLPEEVEFHNASISEEKFYLRATFPRMTQDIRVGDAVTWGVQIKNSEVGAATFAIESFLLQLICKNGMVVTKVLNARHIGKRLDDVLSDEAIKADDHAFWLAARDTLRASMDEAAFEQVVSTLRATTSGMQLQNVPKATERLAKSFSLSEEEKDMVLTRIAAGGDLTRWGAISAITNAAQSVESFDRGVELEEIGWSLAELPNRDWERLALAA